MENYQIESKKRKWCWKKKTYKGEGGALEEPAAALLYSVLGSWLVY
jgi:hypothetical protein